MRLASPVMSAATAETRPKASPDTKPRQPRPWNVVLLDDDDHSYDYVIRIATQLFSYTPEKAFKAAQTVDAEGRVVLLTTHKEHAELKREQVLAFGKDPLIAKCQGPMSCILEPAEFGGDEDQNNADRDAMNRSRDDS